MIIFLQQASQYLVRPQSLNKFMYKKFILSPWLALLTLVLICFIRVIDPTFVESVRLRYFDSMILNSKQHENNIVVANIDEQTLDRYGQWPFKRDNYAEIIQRLYEHNAGLVVWDILMPEKDRLGGDDSLQKTLEKYPVVLVNTPSMIGKNQVRSAGVSVINAQYTDKILSYPGIIANIDELEKSAVGVGSTHTLPEIDGVNRRLPLLVSSGGKIYPSLPIEILRVLAGDKSFQVKLNNIGVDKLRIPDFGAISTDQLGRVWIDINQKPQTISVLEIPNDLHKAVVIVGTSAAGIANPVATAKGPILPQQLQASILGTLISKINISRPNYADSLELFTLIIGGVLAIAISRYTWGFIPVLAVSVGSYFIAEWIYVSYHYLFDITAIIVGIGLVYIHSYTVKFLSEFFQKQQIKKQFEQYLAPTMIKKLQENPGLLKLGGDTRQLTLLFCDIRGFTTISEQYKSNPQGLVKLINRFLTPMTDIIMRHQGTIDKYMGDCIMAFWNAPIDVQEQQSLAVQSAVEMLVHLNKLNESLKKENSLPINIGIGINTGNVVVGNMGSNQRFDYSCIGDAVNLASRLEGQTKDYGVKIIIGHETVIGLPDKWLTIELDTIAVKGKSEAVKIYTLSSYVGFSKPDSLKIAIAQHDKFLDAYRTQRWERAIIIGKSLVTAWNFELKDYYKMMIERCYFLQQNPPGPNWDGVFRATNK